MISNLPLNNMDEATLNSLSGIKYNTMVMQAICIASGLSVLDLAEKSGYCLNGVYNSLRGKHKPNINKVIDLLDTMGFDLIIKRRH